MTYRSELTRTPTCSLSDFVRVINTASTDWVAEKIHPYVPRSKKDTNASYLRKMALWAQATDTYPANDKLTHEAGDQKL
jgi:hypothetical protein